MKIKALFLFCIAVITSIIYFSSGIKVSEKTIQSTSGAKLTLITENKETSNNKRTNSLEEIRPKNTIVEYELVYSPLMAQPYGLPLDLYNKHIQLARNGVAESQYFVHIAVQKCVGTASSYQELYEAIEQAPQYSITMENRFNDCQALMETLEKKNNSTQNNVRDTANHWLEKAKEKDYPLAISLEVILQRSESYSEQEKKIALQNSIKMRRYEGYSHVATYYGNRGDNLLSTSWLAVSCIANAKCSLEMFKEEASLYMTLDNFLELDKKIEHIQNSLDSGELDELEVFN